jgi:hypothetical protein
MATSKHPQMRGTVLSAAEATFYDAVYDAEAAWAAASKSTQALATTADLTKYRAIVAAANTSGLGHLGGPARTALRELTGS